MKSDTNSADTSSIQFLKSRLDTLRDAILESKAGVKIYRREFLEACVSSGDALRVRTKPAMGTIPENIVQGFQSLVPVRNYFIDWVLLESEVSPSNDFVEALLKALANIRNLKLRPNEVTQWNEAWFDAHKLFAYEIFLYTAAALLRNEAYQCLNEIFKEQFLRPANDQYASLQFARFDDFYAYSEIINAVLAPPNQKLYSPAAELVKREAKRTDLGFEQIMEADLLTLLMALIDEGVRWFPQTLLYSQLGLPFPFFLKATRHKGFLHLATITGIHDANKLRTAVRQGEQRLNVQSWHQFVFQRSFWDALNMEKLDTLA